MIEVYGLVMPKYKKLAKSVAELALNFMKQPDLDLTIKFVGKKEIKTLCKNMCYILAICYSICYNVINGGMHI